jgi:hypothetical protein
LSFEDELREDIAVRAEGAASFTEQAFAEELAERLEEAEVVFDVVVERVECRGRRGRRLAILGYAEDPADDTLIVLVGAYYEDPGAVLTLTEAKKVFGSGAGFLEQSTDGWLHDNLEISSKAAEYAEYFAKNLGRFEGIKFILITNATMSDRIKTIEGEVIAGRPASFAIWDLRRFEMLAQSESGRDDIHVDLTRWLPSGLPCLIGAESGQHARSYLAVLPGRLLADVFREYGSQLLESNVRTFLSARGKVNKGIQYTLAHEPSMFLAYNNGLTTTATGVSIEERDGSAFMTSIENWQIVNGGQTTSSLAHFVRQSNDRSLDGVFVQMKLVTVDPETAADLVSNVSRFANSQNKVSEADFFSNSQFHVRLEQISLRLRAPAQEAQQYGTGWFYERTRGQYENSRNALSPAKQKTFDLEFPKNQKITKTDWAKYAFSWAKRPHEVSRGAQSNFATYAVEAEEVWKTKDESVNDAYFRTNVGKAIMYNQLRATVMKAGWYGSGYLANIVAYAMSKLSYEIGRQFPEMQMDFEKVWNRRALGPETAAVLLDAAELMQEVLTDPGRPQSNVTQWAKQVACWDSAKDAPFELTDALRSELRYRADVVSELSTARKVRRMDAGFESVQRVMKVKPETWQVLLTEGVRAGLVTPTEQGILAKAAQPGMIPTERQAARALTVLERSAEHALIARGSF